MKGIYLRLLFIVIVVALLAVSLITFKNFNNYMEEGMLIRNSNSIVGMTQLVLSTMKDAETGQRGFLLTRDSLFLERYYFALSVLPAQLKTLDSLVLENEAQKRNLDSLKILIKKRFLIIETVLGIDEPGTLYKNDKIRSLLVDGKAAMDLIRELTNHMVVEEEKLVILKIENEASYRSVTPIALLFYTLLSIFGVTFLFVTILNALSKREEAEQQVKDDFKQLQLQNLLTEERKVLLNEAESLSQMGSWKWTESTDVLVWSEGLYKIFDKKPDVAISWSSFLERVFHEDMSLVKNFLQDVKTMKSGAMIDYRIIKGGHIHYLSLTVKPHTILNIDILGAVVDITERKEHEKQLEQNNIDLRRSNEDLEQFALVASHDLQEPLRKIRSFGDRLESKYATELDGQGVDYINRMQAAAIRMQSLIEDLLSFSKISREQVDYDLINPVLLLNEVLEDIDMLVKREAAVVEIETIPSFRGDRLQIKRLFQNLIANAIKFHKADEPPQVKIQGKVMNEVEIFNELEISLPSAEYVRIRVKDNGIGFDNDYAEKIFTIFQRLHGRTAYEGTGIGLAICRKIMTNHNGYILAKSQRNVGSEFIVIFHNPNDIHV